MCSATSTTLWFNKRTTLCFCTACRDILSLHIAHAFRFAWFAYHHLQNPWFSLRHGQYTLIFRFYSIFSLADTQNTFSFTQNHQEELILSSLDHCFPAAVFLPNCQAKYTVSRRFYTPPSVVTLLISWASLMINWCWHVWPLGKNLHRRPPVHSFHCDFSQAKPA